MLANTVLPSQDSINIILLKEFFNFSPIFFTFIMFNQPHLFLFNTSMLFQISFLNLFLKVISFIIILIYLFTDIFEVEIKLNISFILFKKIIFKANYIISRLKGRWYISRAAVRFLSTFAFIMRIMFKQTFRTDILFISNIVIFLCLLIILAFLVNCMHL